MVSISEAEAAIIMEEIADAIDDIRLKHGVKKCDKTQARGMFYMAIYDECHVHSLVMGNITVGEILEVLKHNVEEAIAEKVSIPVGN